MNLKDSLHSINNNKAVAETETKYETEKKDKEIAEQKAQLAEKQLEQSQLYIWGGGSILVLVLGGGLGFLLFRQRAKRKTLEERVKSTDKAYGKITTILHDELSADLGLASYSVEVLETMDKESQVRIVADLEELRKRVRVRHGRYRSQPRLLDYNGSR
jgi:hypothetical protein